MPYKISTPKAKEQKSYEIRKKIKKLMKKEKINPKYVSPNFVAEFSYNKGFKNLKSEDIVNISDTYK